MNRIIIMFSESDLPFRVDVPDWHTINPEFKRIIESGFNPLPYHYLVKKGRPPFTETAP